MRATVGDFNQDGIPDFVKYIDGADEIVTGLGIGDGTFRDASRIDFDIYPWRMQNADVNGDQRRDLMILGADLWILAGRGDGSFAAGTMMALTPGARDLAFGDVDGDGKADLVTAHTGFSSGTNDVGVMAGAGDGSFAPAVRFAAGEDPCAVTIADLDLDGIADLIVANNFSYRIAVLWGGGGGVFAEPEFLSTGQSPQEIEAKDLNADGFPDLIVADFTTSDVSLRINRGKRRFDSEQRFSVGSHPRGVDVADFDGDGVPDIATIDELGDSVTILFAQKPLL